MKRMRLGLLIAAVAVSGSLAAAGLAVLAPTSMRGALLALAADHKKQSGNEVSIQFDTSPGIGRRLAAGESADVLIMTTAGVELAIKEGKAVADSRARIGKVAVGVVIRNGARRPDISSVDALKASLLKADAVLYTQGSSGVYVEKMLGELGMADQVKSKAAQLATGVDMMKRIETSRGNEMGFAPVSEIMAEAEAHGLSLVGPLPAALDPYPTFDAAVMSGSRLPDAARAFIRALTTPAGRKVFESNGWER